MPDEWGPWIEHDGKGCPCVGQFVEVDWFDYGRGSGIAGGSGSWTWGRADEPWTWSIAPGWRRYVPIIRYRIRRPRGMEIIDAIIADVPKVAEDA